MNFSVSQPISKSDVLKIIQNIEFPVFTLLISDELKNEIRGKATNIFNNLNKNLHLEKREKIIQIQFKCSQDFLKRYSDLIFTNSDKENLTGHLKTQITIKSHQNKSFN